MKNLFTRAFFPASPSAAELYDLSLLEDLDDTEYMSEVLEVLLRETPRDLKQMKDAVVAGKADMLYQAAHKLKSSSGIIQAATLTDLLANIETMGKSGAVNNELARLVDTAAQQYQHIERALKIHLAGLK